MDTGLYRDIVYTEYMLEHDLTWQQMMEKTHTDEMLKRVAHMEWQDEQRAQWMSGETPQFTVPNLSDHPPNPVGGRGVVLKESQRRNL